MLTLELSSKYLDAAYRKSIEANIPMCIAIVDEAGTLIAFKRMDDALPISTVLAQNKAYTAVMMRCNTKDLFENALPGNDLYGLNTIFGGKITIFGGGVQIKLNGKTVGAIGISGGTTAQDIEVAEAAVASVLSDHA